VARHVLLVAFGLVFAPLLVAVPHAQRPASPAAAAPELTVEQFGAVCDGRTDDSSALQAALTAAAGPPARLLRVPAKTCAFARPLVVGGGRDYATVSVTGVSEHASVLLYTGAASGTAITLSHVAFFRWQNLSVTKANAADFSAHGTSVGIQLTGPFKTGGTMTLAGEFAHVAVSGFKYGMVYGGDDAASEIVCYHCRFAYNDVGWTANGYNSLNFLFVQVDLLGNRRGMEIGGDGAFGKQVTDGPHIIGGSTANNSEADFVIGNTFDTTIIESVRAEPAARFIKGSTGGRLVLRGNSTTPQTKPGDGVVIEMGDFASLLLEQNTLNGVVSVGLETGGSDTTELTMRQNVVVSAPSGLPVQLPPRSRGISLSLEQNVARTQAGTRPFPDFYGSLTSALVPRAVATSSVGEPVPGGGLWLTAVRMLGYGSAVTGRNLRDRVVFAGAATQPHAFKRTVPVTAVNSRSISFARGAITAADIGKTIVLPGANQKHCRPPATPATDAVHARILGVPDDRSAVIATMASGDGRCVQEVTDPGPIANATVGENEPDADYFLLVSCNTSERIHWTEKTATGFTLTSDNPASRAVCDVLIVR
jgi:hypothetical protein